MSAAAGSIRRGRPRGLWAGRIFLGFLVTSLAIGFLTLGALLAQVFLEGYKWVDAVLFFEPPSADPLISGARPAILATIYLGIIIIVLSVPLGVGTAIYLEEYANRDRWYNRMLEVNIQNLAAVPSIVYGILGLAFLVRGIGLGRVLLVGGMILTLLVLPTVIIAAREAIRAVPDSIRQGAYALGSTKWQVVWRQVLPASIPGIATGSILALSRGLGRDRAAAARRSAHVRLVQPDDHGRLHRPARADLPVDRTSPGGVQDAGRGGDHRPARDPPDPERVRDLAPEQIREKVVIPRCPSKWPT